MGIPGLTKFINDRSDQFLKPCELRNTYLVIDGWNLQAQLYSWHTKSLSAFGGDYDLFAEVVRDFFHNLRKCNITPIVIADGGYERKKLKTIHKRHTDRLLMLSNFSNQCWTGVFFPLMIAEAFTCVLDEMGIISVNCFFEADSEIAAVARHLNCPVLSYDSDFYIYDVVYVPFNTVDIKAKESDNGPYISCCIYDVKVLLESFPGIERNLLPLLPALLGNDYVNSSVFNNFFYHVGIDKSNSNNSYTQRRIYGLFQWLRNETLDSAIQRILGHTRADSVDEASDAIKETIENYKPAPPLTLPLLGLGSSEKIQEPLIYIDHKLIKQLPERFIKLYQNFKLPSEFIDIINLNRYYVKIQVEDVRKESSQLISVPIISAIHTILDGLTGVKTKLVLVLKEFKYLSKRDLNHPVHDCLKDINLRNIMSEGRDVKKNIIYQVLSLTDSDREIIEKFDGWILFIMSFVFWVKHTQTSAAHAHSVFLMVLANYIQTKVGFYPDYSHLMRSKAGTINRLSKNETETSNPTGLTFSALLNTITEIETLLFTKTFIKLRRHDPAVTTNGYFITTIHLFASFQSVLKHVRYLNALLDFPLPDIKINEFYSGTLLYNLYFFNNRKTNILRFIYDILRDMPNVKNLYDYILEVLKEYIPEQAQVEKATRMEKKHHKRSRH